MGRRRRRQQQDSSPPWLCVPFHDIDDTDFITFFFDNDEQAGGVTLTEIENHGPYVDGIVAQGPFTGQYASLDAFEIAYLTVED